MNFDIRSGGGVFYSLWQKNGRTYFLPFVFALLSENPRRMRLMD